MLTTQRNQSLFGTVMSAFSRTTYSRTNSIVACKVTPSNSVTPDGGHRSPVALTPSPPSEAGSRCRSPGLQSPQCRSPSFLSVDYGGTSPTPPLAATTTATTAAVTAAAAAAGARLSPSNSLLLSSTDNSRRPSNQR